MDKLNKKVKVPEMSTETKNNLSKWLPVLCAGAAVGMGVIALKEIKTLRTELITKEQSNQNLGKKMEHLEEQILEISEYIKLKQKVQEKKQAPPPPIIKSVIEEEKINVINEDSDEYEEVEVTDDEAE
jgi:hypothetical protein